MTRRQLLQIAALAPVVQAAPKGWSRPMTPEIGAIIGRYGDGHGGALAWLTVVVINWPEGWCEAQWRDAGTDAWLWEPVRLPL